MSIYLGNLKIEELEYRTGWTFTDEERDFLKNSIDSLADFKDPNKLHIFDIPFLIHIGENIFDDVMKILRKYESQTPSKELLQCAKMIPPPKPLTKQEKRKIKFDGYIERLSKFINCRSKKDRIETVKLFKEFIEKFETMSISEIEILRELIKKFKNFEIEIIPFGGDLKLFELNIKDLKDPNDFLHGYNHLSFSQERFYKRFDYNIILNDGRKLFGWIDLMNYDKNSFPEKLIGTAYVDMKEKGYLGRYKTNNYNYDKNNNYFILSEAKGILNIGESFEFDLESYFENSYIRSDLY